MKERAYIDTRAAVINVEVTIGPVRENARLNGVFQQRHGRVCV